MPKPPKKEGDRLVYVKRIDGCRRFEIFAAKNAAELEAIIEYDYDFESNLPKFEREMRRRGCRIEWIV